MANKLSYFLGLFAVIFAVIIVGIPVALYIAGSIGTIPKFQVTMSGQQPTTPGTAPSICKETATTDLYVEVYNLMNEASSETFDVTGYLYEVSNGKEIYVTSITDTTNPSAVEVDCGKTYRLKFVSEDDDSGDNSYVWEVKSGDAKILDHGVVEFTTTSATKRLILGLSQHGKLEVRVKDLIEDEFLYGSGQSSATTWLSGDVTFKTTASNSSPYSVGTGGKFEIEIQYRANATDTNFNDQGYLILIDAASSKWDTPSVSLDGSKLSDAKGSLTPYESRAFSDYEYAYVIPAAKSKSDSNIVGDDEHYLKIKFEALAGVDPGASDDIKVKIVPRGAYLSLDGTTVKYGAVKDDASNTAVFAGNEYTFDIQ